MRVTFLTHNYPRTAGDVSGAFLETLAAALVRRGTAVTVIAPSDQGQGGEEVRAGVRIRRVRYASPRQETVAYRGTMADAVRRPAGLLAVAGLWRALRRAALEEVASGSDLVHAHWWIPSGLAVPKRAPFVLTCHGTDVALLATSGAVRMLARPVFARARVVTTVSRQLARWITESTGRIVDDRHVQPMPLGIGAFQAGQGGGGAVVVARLTRQKRVHLAIEAIAGLQRDGATVPLTVVGDGPERPALEALARTLGIASLVTFAGAIAPKAVPATLARADVMIFPARGEGFGLVAAEALMCGVPVVACEDGGGVLDVVPRDGAGRIVRASGAAIALAIGELSSSSAAATARVAATTLGQRWRERLDPDYVAAAAERWYAEALGG